MDTLKEIDNKLFKRREVEVSLTKAASLNFEGISKNIASHFDIPVENIVVKKTQSSYGTSALNVEAFLYESLDAKNRAEPRKKEKKKEGDTK